MPNSATEGSNPSLSAINFGAFAGQIPNPGTYRSLPGARFTGSKSISALLREEPVSTKKTVLLIVILRFVMGGFWVAHSHDKWGWPQGNELERRLQRYSENGAGIQKAYVDRFALPRWETLQYFVIFGELAVGLAFLAGFLTRAAAVGGVFMAINFLFAQGDLLDTGILGNPYGPVTIMATIVAAYGGGESRWSLSSWLARSKHQPLANLSS